METATVTKIIERHLKAATEMAYTIETYCIYHNMNLSVPLPTIQSKHGWFGRKFANHIWAPGSYDFLPLVLALKGKTRKVHTSPGGSDVVRELLREPAMFQIGLYGEVLNLKRMQDCQGTKPEPKTGTNGITSSRTMETVSHEPTAVSKTVPFC